MTTGRDRLRRAHSAHVLREALQEIEATALVTNEHVEEMADQIAEVLTERGLRIVKAET